MLFFLTLKWANGGRSYDLCIVGFKVEMSKYNSDSWFSIEQAITDLMAVNFINGIPLINKLIKQYSINKWN